MELTDPKSNKIYYCNTSTHETTWDRPGGVGLYPPGYVRPGVYSGQVQMGMASGGYPMIPGAIGGVKHGKEGEHCCLVACMGQPGKPTSRE